MNASNPSPSVERTRTRAWNGEALHTAFASAAETRPWTAGYRSLDRDRISGTAQLTGRLPAGLRGTFYRNGPARHERGGQRYGHRWDGDGMVQQFRFSEQGVSHVGQYVQTEKYLAESACGHFLMNGFGTYIPDSDPVPTAIDKANPANISVLHFGGELLALWEAGSAYRLDPESLETRGPKTWSEALAGKPFSAHPRVEADGTMWNFGVDPLNDELTIYHAGPNGQLLRSHTVKVDKLSPAHDFAVTRRHLIFLLPSLVLNKERLRSGTSFAEACQWSPTLGMRVLVIDKGDWSQQFFELPPGCLFHVANAWEDEQGAIRLHYMRSPEPMSLMAGWSVMRGEYRHFDGARLTLLTLNPTDGTAEQSTIGAQESEFPVIDPADVGVRSERILCLERSAGRPKDLPGFDEVALVDIEMGDSHRYSYGQDWMVEEHLLVRGSGEDRSRWIIGTALDLRAGETVLSVFDVAGLGDGPIAQARLPYALPLGLHGTFVPTAGGN